MGTGLQTVTYGSTFQFPSDLVRDANFMFARLSVTSPVYLPNWQVFLRKWEWREWMASNLLPPPCRCYFVFSNVKHTGQEGGWSTPRVTADSSLKDVFVVLSITGAPGGPGASPVAQEWLLLLNAMRGSALGHLATSGTQTRGLDTLIQVHIFFLSLGSPNLGETLS